MPGVVAGTGEALPKTAPDQVLFSGVLASGVAVSIHYRGGTPRDGAGLLWEINGTEGDIRISGPLSHLQLAPLSLKAARGDEKAFTTLEVPVPFLAGLGPDPVTGDVARNCSRMARDIHEGTRTAPTFDDAVALHRVVEVK